MIKEGITEPIIISYKNLRIAIGALALFIAFGCIFGGLLFGNIGVQSSISAYYYTNMRDFLEGTLLGVGVFLLTYYGYSKLDRILSSAAGLMGICIALFPTYNAPGPVGIFQIDPMVSFYLHMGSAAAFFLLLAYISLFLFTKTGPTVMTDRKKIRNIIYKVCGITILASCLLFGLLGLVFGQAWIQSNYIIIILETVMLMAFGVSWITKGEAIFGDKV